MGKNKLATVTLTIPEGYQNTKIFARSFICNALNIDSKISLNAAKLEKGENQTIAWQDTEGNWNLYETPDYNLELEKCQKYYEQTAYAVCYDVANSTSQIDCVSSIFYTTEKRVDNNTITINDNPVQPLQVIECDNLNEITDAVLEVPVIANKRMLSPKINSPSGEFTTGKMYRVQVPDNAYIVSAEL